jgi:hypothetical protein
VVALQAEVYGIHHWISAKHLDACLDEFTFVRNMCEFGDRQRVNALLGRAGGRLMYRDLIVKARPKKSSARDL